jgi:DNA-binding transcriptional LysR family regulator
LFQYFQHTLSNGTRCTYYGDITLIHSRLLLYCTLLRPAVTAIVPAYLLCRKKLFETRGLQLQVAISTNYLETIKMLISIGLGWSVLPLTMVDAGTHALQVTDVSISRTLGYIHHSLRTLSNAGSAFIKLVELNRDPCFAG